MHKALINRQFSGFPVSIGTSLALETLLDPITDVYDTSRQVPDKINTSTYSNYVFNISTILRNLISSIPSKELLLISKKDILDTLLEEIEWMTNFFQANNLIINFYINNYQYVKNAYKNKDVLRTHSTDKQIYLDSVYKYCLDNLIKEDDVKVFSNDIKYNKEDMCLLLTHVPWDLLSHRNFIKLDLLESNTGIIKTRKKWNTKYVQIPNKDMSFLPFQEYLLSVFGDNYMFKPSALQDRINLYDSLKKISGINPLTDEFSLSLFFKN